ncbi:MAG TPA: response regulator [Methylibium sp.]|nr:response regulator [Methylibium sp.]
MACILVIEDNPINLELMTYLLRAWGHEPVTASDGEAGLALARSARPAMVVCDIQMPGLDGYGVARVLKADPLLRDIPLVALTAYAMVGDEDKALAAGFDLHIAKPVDPKLFMAAIAHLLPGATNVAPAPGLGGAAGAAAVIPTELRAPRDGLVVLLVDDQPANLEFKVSLLEPAGYAVRAAASGSEALAALHAQHVDLVISDVVMARGSGYELLAAMRADASLSGIPFVFLTATARDSASRAHGLALGAEDYLLRPVEPERLLASIRAALLRVR